MMQHKTEPTCRAGVRFVTSSLNQRIDQDPAALVRLHGVGRVDREGSISVAATNGLPNTSHPAHPQAMMQYGRKDDPVLITQFDNKF